MMRRVLINHARGRATEKRGGAAVRLSLEDVDVPAEERAAGVVAVDEALERLSQFSERGSKIVEMRFFGGMSDEEIAEVLGVSTRTVLRDWKAARLREVGRGGMGAVFLAERADGDDRQKVALKVIGRS
jgi:RNA polymerase sigma factor (TIGR02999 family)